MKNITVGILAVLCLCNVPAFAIDAVSADNLVLSITAQLGRSKGVASIPRCGDGQIVRALLDKSGFKIHAMSTDAGQLTASRQLVEPSGQFNRRVFVERGTPTIIPFTDNFVDLIIINNLTDADLAGISYPEIQRALCMGGKAWIGRATAEGAGLNQSALQTWIDGANKNLSTATISTNSGTWAVITKNRIPGTAEWTKRNGPGGDRFVNDSVFAFPWMPQAKLKPYRLNQGSVVAAGGRLYMGFPDNTPFWFANETYFPTKCWLRVYRIFNGELLWTRDLTADGYTGSMTADILVATADKVYLKKGAGWLELDGETGSEGATLSTQPSGGPVVPKPSYGELGNNGCGAVTYSINNTYGTANVYGWDVKGNFLRAQHQYKTPCNTGPAISNGMMISPATQCGCMLYRGNHIEASAGTFQFDQSASATGAERLEKGAAFGTAAAAITPTALDWPTHRANNNRTGGSTALVSSAPHFLWQYKPQFNYISSSDPLPNPIAMEQEPTPPVVVDSFVYWGGTDGYVRCAVAGREKWSFATGGRIFATPTVAAGYVYVGSADGYAYCLNAATGGLAWRFRAAPADRRFNLYGHLSSVWPVISGVLVAGGNAYFVAGMQSEYGAHVYCVNAATGALVWQNNNGGTWYNTVDRLGFSPTGYLTIVSGKLISGNFNGPVCTFDLLTGAINPVPAPLAGNNALLRGLATIQCGREIGVVDGQHIVFGGDLLFRDHLDRYAYTNGMFFDFALLDGSGNPQYPAISFTDRGTVTPAWDAQNFYAIDFGNAKLIKRATADVCAKVDAKRLDPATTTAFFTQGSFYKNANEEPAWLPTGIWRRNDLSFNALVLAGNVLVATYIKTTGIEDPVIAQQGEKQDWYVGVLDKSDGHTISETLMPAHPVAGLKNEPLHQGLAIDRSGNIIVALRNGDMVCYGSGQAVGTQHGATGNPVPVFRMMKQAMVFTFSGLGRHTAIVTTIAGRKVASVTGNGPHAYTINSQTFSSGVYMLQIEDSGMKLTKRVTVAR